MSPLKGSVTQLVTSAYTLYSNPIPLADGTNGLLWHTFYKQVTDIIVDLLWGILTSSLST